MKKVFLTALFVSALMVPDLFPQSKLATRNSFFDAESWLVFEDYAEALRIYQELQKKMPDNYNIKYRIGQCYLNIPGEKSKSISFLEEASRHINPKYREGNFNETGAPTDVLYYLANAYRIDNQLDKAVETYKVFRKNLNPKIYDSTLVDFQIQTCLNAKELMKVPVYIREKNLGRNINDSKSEFNPVVSDKEELLVFSKSEAFYDAILYSVKRNGEWSAPMNMNEILRVDRDYFPTSLSKDGKDLYLYSSTDYDGIIYTTRFENGKWSPLVKLNDNINTKYWESHATISHDNKKLYFTSNRKGSYGESLDIYVSSRDSTGDWGPARNLGPVINTIYNEESPFLSDDDKTLFFSSRGHFNIGGYDIFNSTLQPNGEWSVPLNIGYPMNTTDDETFFNPMKEGFEGYIARERTGGAGALDIYRVEIFNSAHPRRFYVKGMAKLSDLLANNRDSIKVSAMNIKDPDQTVIVYTDPSTGEYEFELPQGSYLITYEANSAEKFSRNLELSLTHPADSLQLPETVMLMIAPVQTIIAEAEPEMPALIKEPEKPVPAMIARKREKPVLPAGQAAKSDASKKPAAETKAAAAPVPQPAPSDTISVPEKPSAPAVDTGKTGRKGIKGLFYWVFPGALLFIFIILFWRRRKKKEE